MLELKVLYMNRKDESAYCQGRVLHHKKPRLYMCGWSFEKMMKYAKDELSWEEINEKDVRCFIIINEKQCWYQAIRKGN